MPFAALQMKNLLFLPYFFLASFFIISYGIFTHLPQESLASAVFKSLPIWYLAAIVGQGPDFKANSLGMGARVGLVLSGVGDVCMTWRNTLFLPGMFFFGLAHIGYIFGLRSRLRRGGCPTGEYVREFGLACIMCYLFFLTGIDSVVMAGCVLGYSVLIFTMANLALQRYLGEGSQGAYYGLVGAAFFLLSDFIIAVNKWKFAVPVSEAIIMVTYYAAQLGITAGAIHSHPVKFHSTE